MALEFNRPNGLCLEGNLSENFKMFKQEIEIYFKATETTPKLINKKYYSVLDLRDGYYHIKLDEKSSKYCTFSTPFGNFRFIRLAFRLSVAPEPFMKQN